MNISDEYLMLFGGRTENCSQNSSYHVWIHQDGYIDENNFAELRFSEEGYQSIILRAFSKDGRKYDEITSDYYVGYMRVDSIVINHLSNESFKGNMSLQYAGYESLNSFTNPTAQDLPLTYTFNNSMKITQVDNTLGLFNSSTNWFTMNFLSEENDTSPTQISGWAIQNGNWVNIDASLYWHFNK